MEINRWFSRPESVHVSPSDHSIGSGGFFFEVPTSSESKMLPRFGYSNMCGASVPCNVRGELWVSVAVTTSFSQSFHPSNGKNNSDVPEVQMFTIGPIGFPNMLFSFVDVVWTHRIAQSCSWDDPNLQGFWGEAWTEKRLCVGHFPAFTKDGSWYDDAHYGAQVRTVGRVQWVELGSLMGLWVKFMDPLPMFVRTCVCFCQELSPRHYP